MPPSSDPQPQDLALRLVESPTPSAVGGEIPLNGKVTIGRADDCTIMLDDPTASRLHAEIRADDGRILLLDRGSANGVWFGDRKIDRAELKLGDSFRIGATVFELVDRVNGAPNLASAAPLDTGPADATLSAACSSRRFNWPPREGLFGAGEPVEASGHQAFLIDEPGVCWLVESGKVEIFGVDIEGGEPTGARWHFLSIAPGEAMFGMNLARYGGNSGFLAVGRGGTLLRRIPVTQLAELAAAGDLREEVARLVDGWVAGLSKSLVRELIPGPRVDLSFFDQAEIVLGASQKARSAKGVVWLEGEGLRLLFLGLEDVERSRGEVFPLTPDGWVEALTEGDRPLALAARATFDLVAEPALWRGLERFNEALCRLEFVLKRTALVDEINRQKTKAQYSQAAAGSARESLAAVMASEVTAPEHHRYVAGDDSLLAALRLVGAALGAEVRGHPSETEPDLSYTERLGRIAKASNLRTRVVALRGEWWRADQGPILARRAGSDEAVALLPRGATAYDWVAPGGGRRHVNEELAAELEPFGHVVYRPLPAKTLAVRDLLRFGLRGLGGDLRMLTAMGIALGVLGALAPYFSGRAFDSAIPEAETSLLLQLGFALGIAAIASAAFKLVQSVAVVRLQGRMDYTLQAALWDRLLNLPSTFFRRYSAGDLGERAAGISAIRHALAGAGVSSILGAFSSVFFVGLMIWYDWKLGLVAVLLSLLFVAATTTINLLQLKPQREELNLRGRISGLVLQLVAGVGKLRVAGAENHAYRVWADQFAEQRRKTFRIGRLENLLAVINSSFPIFASLVIFAALSSFRAKAQAAGASSGLTTGQFIGFSAAFALFLAALQALADASLNLLRIVPIYERLRPILTTSPESDETKAYPGRLKGGIELSHLHFHYGEEGPWVLRDVTLSIKPGEFVAFVGSSGSGKSTLMRLMLGFETPQKGSIYYDGQDLLNLDLRELRQQLGVVLQESMVLPADLYRNIVGSSSRSLDEAWEAVRQVGLEEDVRQMPMGMHTYVSEGGAGLSGGQRQRLLIARAVVAKPRLLFMDEATSALDNRSQATVTDSLDRLQATRVVIAHRLSTIVNADRIYLFDDGVIAESGNYEELMQKDGLFAQLARRQRA